MLCTVAPQKSSPPRVLNIESGRRRRPPPSLSASNYITSKPASSPDRRRRLYPPKYGRRLSCGQTRRISSYYIHGALLAGTKEDPGHPPGWGPHSFARYLARSHCRRLSGPRTSKSSWRFRPTMAPGSGSGAWATGLHRRLPPLGEDSSGHHLVRLRRPWEGGLRRGF